MEDHIRANPFKISIADEKLVLLRRKLELATFPDEILLSQEDWSQGPPLAVMRRLTEYWRSGYDWRAAEANLNAFPQFITQVEVEGFEPLDVHFLHINRGRENTIPLIMIHGWPGTFYELTKILKYLTDVRSDEEGPEFEIVVPSLIGYGFSDSAKVPGFSAKKQAEMCHNLMLKLGFNQYVAQGGDWGMVIAHMMSALYYPQHLKAYHINNSDVYEAPSIWTNPWHWLTNQLRGPYSIEEKRGIERTQKFLKDGFGYNMMHSYRPQTIGYSLQDSPVGLLAWILDKLHEWTDDYPWSDDEILTWVSIFYHSTGGPTSSIRLYYESKHMTPEDRTLMQKWTSCPAGISHFPKDINVSPTSWAKCMGNIVFENVHKKGGHFAAWETPEILASDLKEMFRKWDWTK